MRVWPYDYWQPHPWWRTMDRLRDTSTAYLQPKSSVALVPHPVRCVLS